MMKANSSRTISRMIIFYFLMILPFLLYLVPMEGMFNPENTLCLFRNIFGRECWGCGMTRAFFCVLYGMMDEALAFNRLILIVFPMLCALWLTALTRLGGKLFVSLKDFHL